MVATYLSASSWRPTSRALAALFTGSAVMFAAAVAQGGSLLAPADQVRPAAEPLVEGAGATQSPGTATAPGARSVPAAPSAPGQATPWTPAAAAPERGAPLRDLPVRRAPVQQVPQHSGAGQSTAEGESHSHPGFADSGSRGAPAEQGDNGVVDDMLRYLGKGIGT
ncbi:MAG: hypothetical protein ACRDTE_13985 [Pseudonocardiaceae bacterium]